jgi:NAD(P)-dependent dehydrogenase (short-subunit alcohol dehydrogenase family)
MNSRVALVTGGSRGIGRQIAFALARAGHRVAITYKSNREKADGVVKQIESEGGAAIALPLDISERSQVRGVVRDLKSQLGSVAILVNNAAIAQEKPFESITDDDWDLMLATNLRGPFATSQEVIPDMVQNRWGRIINITSIGGQWGGMNQVHYAASKAALINFTRSLARLYSGFGICTNAVAVGLVQTEMSNRELTSEAGKEKVRGIPAGRVGTADEVADAIVFLASEDASYVMGQTINLNGGMYFS